jgi:hypothetical protein
MKRMGIAAAIVLAAGCSTMSGQVTEDDVDHAYIAKVHQSAKGTNSQVVWISTPKKRSTGN